MFVSVVTNTAGDMDAGGRSKDLTVLLATSLVFSTHKKEHKEVAPSTWWSVTSLVIEENRRKVFLTH